VRHPSYRVTEGTSYREATRVVPRPFNTVVVDAGHGGHDLGGIPSNIIPEKGVALDVALRLAAHLRRAGIHTVLTRSDDTFIPLPERVAISNAQPSSIFVSIHFNAGARREARGYETYYCAPEAIPLAERIQRHLIDTYPTDNRGVKQAYYYVLRKADTVAVLAECGFLTNPYEASLALNPAYRQKLADEIGEAIIEYKRGMD
jgi:N-acetylmuramoyl-L-alanine amidase